MYTLRDYLSAISLSSLVRDLSADGATTTRVRVWRAARGLEPVTYAESRAVSRVSMHLVSVEPFAHPTATRLDELTLLSREVCAAARHARLARRALRQSREVAAARAWGHEADAVSASLATVSTLGRARREARREMRAAFEAAQRSTVETREAA